LNPEVARILILDHQSAAELDLQFFGRLWVAVLQ
jgi:hypothetical protein